MAAGGLVSTPGCFPALSQVLAGFVPAWCRLVPPLSDVATSFGKVHNAFVRLVTKMIAHSHGTSGPRVALHSRKPPSFCLEDRWRACAHPTSGPACRLFPSPVQVLPVGVPPLSATLVLSRWDHHCTAERLCHTPAPHEHKQESCRSEGLRTSGGKS